MELDDLLKLGEMSTKVSAPLRWIENTPSYKFRIVEPGEDLAIVVAQHYPTTLNDWMLVHNTHTNKWYRTKEGSKYAVYMFEANPYAVILKSGKNTRLVHIDKALVSCVYVDVKRGVERNGIGSNALPQQLANIRHQIVQERLNNDMETGHIIDTDGHVLRT